MTAWRAVTGRTRAAKLVSVKKSGASSTFCAWNLLKWASVPPSALHLHQTRCALASTGTCTAARFAALNPPEPLMVHQKAARASDRGMVKEKSTRSQAVGKHARFPEQHHAFSLDDARCAWQRSMVDSRSEEPFMKGPQQKNTTATWPRKKCLHLTTTNEATNPRPPNSEQPQEPGPP